MTAAQRQLVLFLRVSAVILLLALAALVLPHRAMNSMHGWLGLGDLPDTPMVSYLARSSSALYASLGAMYFYLARDVRRHLDLLRFLGLVKLVFGAAMLLLDVAVGMPLLWTLVEGPFILDWSLTLLGLTHRVSNEA